MPEKKTFFISRAGPDKRWAELIASVWGRARIELQFCALMRRYM